MFRTDRARLTAVLIVAAVCGFILVLPAPALLTAPAAVLLVLVVPGYAVMRAIFGRRLEVAEQVAITFGFSVAVTIATGLGLNLLPYGLSVQQWGGMLGAIGVIACLIAIVRGGWTRSQEPEALPDRDVHPAAAEVRVPISSAEAPSGEAQSGEMPSGAEAPAPAADTRTALPRAQVAMIGVAIVLLVVALGVARLGVAAQPHDPFTEFWMLPDPSGQTVQVGVTNEEGSQTTYTFLLRIDGKTQLTLTDFVVAQDGTWEQALTLPFTDANPHSVTALLYRTGDTLPYREAHSTIKRAAASGAVTSPGPVVPTPAPSRAP